MTTCQGGGGTGTLYSYAQVEALWNAAGGPTSYAPLMAAIATAESGRCSTAYNSSGASGLWQILGAVDPSDQDNLFNPQVNAKEAVLKFRAQGLGAWVTYTSGAYKPYLQGSVPPDASGTTGTGGSGVSTTAAQQDTADCLVGWQGASVPGLSSLPLIGGTFSNIGTFCLISKSEARSLIGGGLVLVGGGIAALGLIILTAYGLRASSAQAAVRRSASAVPLGGAAAGTATEAAAQLPVAAVA